VNKLRILALGMLNFRCARCFITKKLEFAHTAPTQLNGRSRGQRARFEDVINNPGKYVLLCKEHHKEYDDNDK